MSLTTMASSAGTSGRGCANQRGIGRPGGGANELGQPDALLSESQRRRPRVRLIAGERFEFGNRRPVPNPQDGRRACWCRTPARDRGRQRRADRTDFCGWPGVGNHPGNSPMSVTRIRPRERTRIHARTGSRVDVWTGTCAGDAVRGAEPITQMGPRIRECAGDDGQGGPTAALETKKLPSTT